MRLEKGVKKNDLHLSIVWGNLADTDEPKYNISVKLKQRNSMRSAAVTCNEM